MKSLDEFSLDMFLGEVKTWELLNEPRLWDIIGRYSTVAYQQEEVLRYILTPSLHQSIIPLIVRYNLSPFYFYRPLVYTMDTPIVVPLVSLPYRNLAWTMCL